MSTFTPTRCPVSLLTAGVTASSTSKLFYFMTDVYKKKKKIAFD